MRLKCGHQQHVSFVVSDIIHVFVHLERSQMSEMLQGYKEALCYSQRAKTFDKQNNSPPSISIQNTLCKRRIGLAQSAVDVEYTVCISAEG